MEVRIRKNLIVGDFILGPARRVVRIRRGRWHSGARNLYCNSSRFRVTWVAILAMLAGCQGGAQVARSTKAFPVKTGFIERHVVVDGFVRPVWVFLPPDYNPNKLYPAILFLHG